MTVESAESIGSRARLPSPDARIPHLHASAPLDAILEALDENGIVVLRDALAPDLLRVINTDLDPLMADIPLGITDAPDAATANFLGGRTKHLNRTLHHSETIRNHVALHPRVLEVSEAVLLPYCRTLQLQALSATEIYPGEKNQSFHRDDALWPAPGERYPMSIQTMFALSDFEAELGATRVLPGSHRWPDAKHFDPANWQEFGRPKPDLPAEAIASVEMPAGSAFIWSGWLFHGAGANTTRDRVRRSIIMGYALGWLRGEANQWLLYPPEIAKNFPRKLQELLGYQMHGILGGVELAQSPIALLED